MEKKLKLVGLDRPESPRLNGYRAVSPVPKPGGAAYTAGVAMLGTPDWGHEGVREDIAFDQPRQIFVKPGNV